VALSTKNVRTEKEMTRTLMTLAALVCGLTLTAAEQPPSAWNGTWKYNKKRSEVPGRTADTIVISYGSDEVMTVTGSPFGPVCRGKPDGSPSPIIGALGAKHPELATCAQKIISPGVLEVSQMYDGKLMATDTWTMAADGKSFIDVSTPGPGRKEKSIKVLYERQ
jgi:hypothetical protein